MLIIIIQYGLNVVDPSVLYCALRARVSFRCLISILLRYVTLRYVTREDILEFDAVCCTSCLISFRFVVSGSDGGRGRDDDSGLSNLVLFRLASSRLLSFYIALSCTRNLV